MLDQPAGRPQASQRPPRADHVEVDAGAVAGDDIAKVLLVSERQAGEVRTMTMTARMGLSSRLANCTLIARKAVMRVKQQGPGSREPGSEEDGISCMEG